MVAIVSLWAIKNSMSALTYYIDLLQKVFQGSLFFPLENLFVSEANACSNVNFTYFQWCLVGICQFCYTGMKKIKEDSLTVETNAQHSWFLKREDNPLLFKKVSNFMYKMFCNYNFTNDKFPLISSTSSFHGNISLYNH